MSFSSFKDLNSEERAELEQAILNAALDAIVTIDVDQNIVEWNRAAEEIFGYSHKEAIGAYMPNLIVPDAYQKRHAEGMARYLATGEGPALNTRVEVTARHKNGHQFPIELAISPVRFRGKLLFTARLRDISDRVRHERRQQALIHEMNHRVKNVLAVVSAMLRLTHATNVDAYKKTVQDRITSLANIHNEVARSDWTGAYIREMVEKQFEPWTKTQFHSQGPTVALDPTAAQAFGIIVHELLTNASKHGSIRHPSGQISLTWDYTANGDMFITWLERNGPPIQKPAKYNFGVSMIERFALNTFGFPATITWNPKGLECRFTIPQRMLVMVNPREGWTP